MPCLSFLCFLRMRSCSWIFKYCAMCSLSGLTLLTQLKFTDVTLSCGSFLFTSISFSLRSPVPLCEYTTLPVSECLDCFQFLDVINTAALHLYPHSCMLVYSFCRNGITRVWNMWMFNLGKQFSIVLQWLYNFTLSLAVPKYLLDPSQHSVLSFWTFSSGLCIKCHFIVVLLCTSLLRMRSGVLSRIY